MAEVAELAREERLGRVRDVLHQAAETHHIVYRITDGEDDDWASWYADWLVRLSELPDVLDRMLVRSELTFLLVSLDREYVAAAPSMPWEQFYAQRLLDGDAPSLPSG